MTTLEQQTDETWSAPALHEVRAAGVPDAPVRPAGSALRRALIGLDVAAATLGWMLAFALTGSADAPRREVTVLSLVAVVAITVAMVAGQRLYLSRVCAIRTVEISRVARAVGLASLGALALRSLAPVALSAQTVLAGAVFSFVLLNLARSGFRTWLHTHRRDGRFLRSVVIIGGNDEGYDLFRLVADHPETGFAAVAVAGETEPGLFPTSLERLRLGAGLVGAVRATGANGVVIASSALHHVDLNRYVREFLRAGIHVHLSSGLRGVDHRRLRSQPVAHEPLFYVEGTTLARWQRVTKRGIDIVFTLLGGVVVLPVLGLSAIAIKIQGPGPIIFKQRRVGRDGVEFTIYKLRTMVQNAESMYGDLAKTLAGRDGPLIKLANDPRRTTVGRFLERLSLDELPQLWNVLRGEMSLVGPRPAQASEIAGFDEELRGRLAVWPGLTGLWQVEARDNPSFAAYRRYDLFYIENWSVTLDLAILFATFQRVGARGLGFILRRQSDELTSVRPRVVLDEA